MVLLPASTLVQPDPDASAGFLPRPASERFRRLPLENEAAIERVFTRDGRALQLRSIRPSDAPLLQRCFLRLSPLEVRRRFMHAMAVLSPAMLQRLSHVDPAHETALALIEAGPLPELHAVARAYVDATTLSAEFSLMVERDWSRQGLGGMLMQRLIDDTRARGLQELWGYVLVENEPMMRLCNQLGFVTRLAPQEPGTVVLSRAL
ncbi:N-acetyltransferase family protein [Frateuria aurantia]